MPVFDLNHHFGIEFEVTTLEVGQGRESRIVCNHFKIKEKVLYLYYGEVEDIATKIPLESIINISVRAIPYNLGE